MSKISPEKMELNKFYKPYLSDEEYTSESDSETDTGTESETSTSESSSSSSCESTTIEARQNIFTASGFPVDKMSGDKLPNNPTNVPVALNQTTTKFVNSKNTTTIMINSTDRDTNLYPQPTSFSIRLPRTYRNVVSISVTQIKLLSSFYYFSDTKNNTSIRVLESGRTRINKAGKTVNNSIDIYLTNGTYDTNSLVTELQNQLNRSPLYNNISLTTFISQFISTGNYSLLFNDPGDTTYNPLTGIFENLQTKNQIVSRYFNITVGNGISYYTPSQCLVAYYYPMLRDMTIGNVPVVTPPVANPFSNNCSQYIINNSKTYPSLNYYLTDPVALNYLGTGNYYDRIVYGFQGLDDPYIKLLINNPGNQAILQQFKDDNTWTGYLLNNYTCSYNTNSGRLTIYSTSLNTSLVTTLNNAYQTILLQQYTNAGIDPNNVASILVQAENLNGVIIDMYNYIQTAFTDFFAIDFGTYTPTFFTDKQNSVYVSDASGRYGWNLVYTGSPQISNSSINYPDASGSWPNLKFNTANMQLIGSDLFYQSPFGQVQYTYTQNGLITDNSGNIVLNGSNEETMGYQDISFNIIPTTYARVPIQSRCRQTLYVETIPPFVSEIPPVGTLAEQYYLDPVHTPLLYQDVSANIILLDPVASDFFMFDISQNMLDGPDFMRQTTPYGQLYLSFVRQQKPVPNPNIIPPPGCLSMYNFRPHIFVEIHHNNYPVAGTDTLFSSDIYIEREDGLPIGVDINAYWYRDRAAFMADVSNALVNVYWNNPKNYFISQKILSTATTGIVNANFISNQISYLMVTTTATSFSKIPLRIFTILHNSYGVYTFPSVNDYRLLPINTSYLASKPTPASNPPYNYPTLFNSVGFRNSYDLNGVSNNLLDYMILTTDFSHYDPYNFVNNTTINQNPLRYVFQFLTPAVGPAVDVSTYSQFFPSGSSNAILDIVNNSIYYNSLSASNEITNKVLPYNGLNNEYVFVNWFRAGATINLYNSGATSPALIPEETIAPYPSNDVNGVDNPFSVFDSIDYSSLNTNPNYQYYNSSPFSLCKNSTNIITDISYNDLSSLFRLASGQIYLGPDRNGVGSNITGIMGIPFTPPLGHYVVPRQVIIKFAYTQPSFDILTNPLSRSTRLGLTNTTPYSYVTVANNSTYVNAVSDMQQWDDQFYQNRQNLVLGVYRSSSINGNNIGNISLGDALYTLTLKKITQICEYSSSATTNVNSSKTRSPDWGTYYIYETSSVATNNWIPVSQNYNAGSSVKTQWAAVNKPADLTSSIFTTIQSPSGTDTKTYYTDVSNNSLCFVPFYPNLNNSQLAMTQDTNPTVPPFQFDYSYGNWSVGTFRGLTYTTRPYIPILKAGSLAENPYIFYSGAGLNSVCAEVVGTGGISLGDTSTYLGAAGPLCWAVDDAGTIVSPNYRNGVAFTPTFFNIRINLTISDTQYNPLTDLSAFGELTNVNKCYSDTQLYVYDISDKPGSDYNDVKGAWGSEKAVNFLKFDDDSGYNYLSYIPKIKIDKGGSYSFLVRGFVPTVKFLTGLRISGKNYTDFGEVSLQNICDEIALLIANGVSINSDGTLNNDAFRIANFFSADYTRALLLFNSYFVGTRVFGKGFTNASYIGQTITSTGFSNFLDQYIGLVNQTIGGDIQAVTTAQTNALVLMKTYINTNYGTILPSIVLTRNNFTDPLTFSILFESALVAPYSTAYDQWGLGWNLGFIKVDTPFATRHVANSFIKIVDDFIYLQLDEELNLNVLDVSNKEDLAQTRDTVGEKQKYYGKLLLNTFGSFAQTFVQSAKVYASPLGKLDKITFAWYNANHVLISNNDCEYNLVMEITEMIDTLDNPSIKSQIQLVNIAP